MPIYNLTMLHVTDPHLSQEGQPAPTLKEFVAGLRSVKSKLGELDVVLLTGDLSRHNDALKTPEFV
jgi:hypothetical protein